jgi:heme exporter protein C
MLKNWWKIVTIFLLMYVFLAAFLLPVPRLAILNESLRNVFFHPPMWISMLSMMLLSTVYSIKYLKNNNIKEDIWSSEFARMGIVFGLLGCITGSCWAYFTWGALWPNDPKTNSVAVAMLIYVAYFILRSSLNEQIQRARISAVYNIFAFAVFIPLIFILPRLTVSLHPGNGGNPGFNQYDSDGTITWIIRPAFLGFTLLGIWVTQLRVRTQIVERALEEHEEKESRIQQNIQSKDATINDSIHN